MTDTNDQQQLVTEYIKIMSDNRWVCYLDIEISKSKYFYNF